MVNSESEFRNVINIAVCLDDAYYEATFLLINSIIETNNNEVMRFHIIFNSLRDEFIKNLSKLQTDLVSLFFHRISMEQLRDCPIRPQDHVSLVTYFRILLPVIIPDDVKKILYVDGDILCLNKIIDLYYEDITDFSMAASLDSQCENTTRKEHLGLDSHFYYFGAGVLLVNLEYWRTHNVHIKVLEYIQRNPEKCVWHDQDALNAILKGTIKQLDFRYNFYETFFKIKAKSCMSDTLWQIVLRDRENICFLHYSQTEKPWFFECTHPLRRLWRAYYKKIFGKKVCLKFKYKVRKSFAYIKQKILSTIFHLKMNENYEVYENSPALTAYFEKLHV